ncbi:MAG: sulfite exporter TauE/SafE family protein [Woeseiaceae bacterium]
MDPEFVLLIFAVFAAATLQAATGIGFGIIAGPLLLATLNDGSAIQISIILNLLIATLLVPSVRQHFDSTVLPKLVLGLLIGSPLGLAIFMVLDIVYLKALAALFVLLALFFLLFGNRWNLSDVNQKLPVTEKISIGTIAGIMGGSLAMPGPVPAAWMAARGFGKVVTRATILIMFIFAYVAALLLQAFIVGISKDTVLFSAELAIPTAVGILAGRYLSHRISEAAFRSIIIVVLIATAVTLLLNLND